MSDYALDLYKRLLSGGEADLLAELRRDDPEHVQLDFKRVNTPTARYSKARGNTLDKEDLTNLGRALSGFANSRGGVVVWGLDCTGNDPSVRKITPGIESVGAFKGTMMGLISRATMPGLSDVLLDDVALPSISSAGNFRSALLMYVPRREYGPVQATIGDDSDKFYFRVGESFAPVPYNVLASMFGKAPPPSVTPTLYSLMPEQAVTTGAIKVGFYVGLINEGQGMAFHAFCDVEVDSPRPGFDQQFNPVIEDDRFKTVGTVRTRLTFVARDGEPLPAGAQAIPGRATLTLVPPFERPLCISVTAGAEHGLPKHVALEVPVERLESAYKESQKGLSQADVWKLLFP